MKPTDVFSVHLFIATEAMLGAEESLAEVSRQVTDSNALQRALFWKDVAVRNLKHAEQLLAPARKGAR